MSYFIIFVASHAPLTISHLAKAESYIEQEHLGLAGKPRWLNRHHAADLAVYDKPDRSQIHKLRALFSGDEVDVFVVPAESRRKKLLLADMDSTIITSETLDEIAAHAGIGEQVSAITARAMRGELDFGKALSERVSLLQGQSEAVLQQVLAETKCSEGAETLVSVMNETGADCVLVSGGFTFFTEAIARKTGFQHNHGNILEIQDGLLTGKVRKPVLDKNAKLDLLIRYRDSLGLKAEETMAIGDGANDLPMLLEAGLGIGYRPKPLLLEALDNCILYGDLTAALYIQGFRTENTRN